MLWRNLLKITEFLRFWKTRNFQIINDNLFHDIYYENDIYYVEMSCPYLQYFPRYKQLKSVRAGSGWLISIPMYVKVEGALCVSFIYDPEFEDQLLNVIRRRLATEKRKKQGRGGGGVVFIEDPHKTQSP